MIYPRNRCFCTRHLWRYVSPTFGSDRSIVDTNRSPDPTWKNLGAMGLEPIIMLDMGADIWLKTLTCQEWAILAIDF
jgi:hypothetical protein